MQWTVSDAGNGITLIELDGRLDVAGALAVDPAFGKVAAENMNVIVDMSKVDFLASLGIRTLVSACKALRAKNGGMVLLSPQSNVEQVLRSSGIDTIIAITTTRQEAEATVLA
jgi:stage II sporulation protein AA (anti-sigma F factor antagonist)